MNKDVPTDRSRCVRSALVVSLDFQPSSRISRSFVSSTNCPNGRVESSMYGRRVSLMPAQVVKPSQKQWIKALLFGPTGVGKTYLLGTAQADPRTNPMLILDFEGGTNTLSGLDIDVIQIRSWEDYDDAEDLLLKPHPYKSLAIDSLSETHMFAILNILDVNAEKRISQDKSPDIAAEGDYGVALIQMRRLIRRFRDLPLHVFFTALDQDGVEPGFGAIKKPALFGKLANEAPGLMDLSAYYTWLKKNPTDQMEVRTLCLKNYSKYRAKVRTVWGATNVPDELRNPTMTALMDALQVPLPKGD